VSNYAIAYICLQIVGALFLAHMHGKPQVGNYNFWVSVVCASPAWACVYFGGFFK
jgi:hypothetical protein